MTKTKNKAETSGEDCGSKKVRCKTLIINGGKYRTTLTKKYENRKVWEKPNPKNNSSYIPGTIKDIFVKEGDKVKQGDKMLLLEAMKMLNVIEVPMDGIVKKIHISLEQRIPKGHLMVEFE